MMKTASIFAGALLLVTTTAHAQAIQVPERRVTTEPASTLSTGPWILSVAPFDGYDHTGFGTSTNTSDAIKKDVLQQSGQRAGVTTKLKAGQTRGTVSLSFDGGSTTTYLFTGQKALTDANAAAGQAKRIGPRTTLTFVESFSYAPYFSLGLFPDLDHEAAGSSPTVPVVPTFALGVSTAQVYRGDLGGLLSHAITDVTTVEAHGSVHRTRIRSESQRPLDGAYQDIGLRVSHRLSQVFGYHVGYNYEHATYAGNAFPTMFHNIDAGVDVRKPLTSSRRTILSFTTGTTIVRYQDANGDPAIHQPPTQYRVLVNADIEQYIGRTWTARVSYRRDFQELEGFTSPFFRNAVSAGIGGKFSSRTSGGTKISYLRGSLEGQPGNDSGHAFTNTGFLQVAVARDLVLFGQYTYYQHRFESVAPGLNLPLQFDRSSVRVGLALSLPSTKR